MVGRAELRAPQSEPMKRTGCVCGAENVYLIVPKRRMPDAPSIS